MLVRSPLCRVAGGQVGKETLERRRSGQTGRGLVRRGERKRVESKEIKNMEHLDTLVPMKSPSH